MKLEDFRAQQPPFTVLFWADGEPLGELTFKKEPFGQQLSKYFYCHVCDEVWGMVEYPNRHWLPQHLVCRQHRDERSAYFIPGSMLDALITKEELSAYPEALIRREFEVHLTNAIKEIENEQAASNEASPNS